jgi:hypothetical protein
VSPISGPTILVIDDDAGPGNALRTTVGKDAAEVIVRTPDDLEEADLRDADLVLVDYELKGWNEEGELTSAPNGLALSAVIREQMNEMERPGAGGVALYSGQVSEIAANLPAEVRGFTVARLNNLEWVFEKDDDEAHQGVASLARAVSELPENWPGDADGANLELHKVLDLRPKAEYFETAREDIDACHPPIHELSGATHALAVIRWLAQRILPYPAFLTDRFGLAARLRIGVDELDRVLAGKSALMRGLEEVRYTGALEKLFGMHWWRSGLDGLIFDWTDGGQKPLEAKVQSLAGRRKLNFVDADLVPVIDSTYRPTDIVAVDTAVRLRPDDWPVFADQAWGSIEVVSSSAQLRGLVLPADLSSLESSDG